MKKRPSNRQSSIPSAENGEKKSLGATRPGSRSTVSGNGSEQKQNLTERKLSVSMSGALVSKRKTKASTFVIDYSGMKKHECSHCESELKNFFKKPLTSEQEQKVLVKLRNVLVKTLLL